MKFQIKKLTPENLTHAATIVTESMDLDVRRGWRDDDFRADWMIEYHKVTAVANGAPFVGLVGYVNHNQPVALSIMAQSMVYGENVAMWDWFFLSPRVRVIPHLGFRLAKETILKAKGVGATEISARVHARNDSVQRAMKWLGLKPIEIEYHADLNRLKPRVLRRKNHANRRRRESVET